MNIFLNADDFVNLDNRRLRSNYTITFDSLYNKIHAQLPVSIIENKSILDLGSCLGAAGYYALMNKAKHYTGVECQHYYSNTSRQLLQKYFENNLFTIHEKNMLDYLNESNERFDIVLLSGVLYGFLDPIMVLNKVSNLDPTYIIIDTRFVPLSKNVNKTGIMLILRNEKMVRGIDKDHHDVFQGVGSRMCSNAIDIVMNTNGYYLDEYVNVNKINDTVDPYNEIITHPNGAKGPRNFIVRYKKNIKKENTLEELIK